MKSLAGRFFSKLTLVDESVCLRLGLYLFDVTTLVMCKSTTLIFSHFPLCLLMVNGQFDNGNTGLGCL